MIHYFAPVQPGKIKEVHQYNTSEQIGMCAGKTISSACFVIHGHDDAAIWLTISIEWRPSQSFTGIYKYKYPGIYRHLQIQISRPFNDPSKLSS